MSNNTVSTFVKGVGAGMLAGAAVTVAAKMVVQDNHNISKGSTKLIKAMGDIVDGVQTMFK